MATTHSSTSSLGYVNIKKDRNSGTVVVDLSKAPEGKEPHGYINVTLDQREVKEGREGGSLTSSPKIAGSTSAAAVSASIDIPSSNGGSPRKRGDGGAEAQGYKERTTSHSADQAMMMDAKLGLILSGEGGGGGGEGEGGAPGHSSNNGNKGGNSCKKCGELNQLLAMWEIGVSGLTRNYSRILAHLIKTQNAFMALQCRLENPTSSAPQASSHPPTSESTMPPRELASLAPPTAIPKNRQSMYINNRSGAGAVAGGRDRDIAENMYPSHRSPNTATTTPTTPATSKAEVRKQSPHGNGSGSGGTYLEDLKEANSHLGGAIDLCQQLAAACFKTNHLSDFANARNSSCSSSCGHKMSPASRKRSVPEELVSGSSSSSSNNNSSSSSYRPSLNSIAEIRMSGTGGGRGGRGGRVKTAELGKVSSAPNLECSGEMSSSSDSHTDDADGDDDGGDLEGSFIKVSKEDIPSLVTKSKVPPHAAGSKEGRDAMTDPQGSSPTEDNSLANHDSTGSSVSSSGVGTLSDGDLRPESIISTVSTYSDSDVKCVMSKIASLEDERYKLLETINGLQEDNNLVRLSMQEILGDLENKDLQLTLAMQDLTIATGEIRKAADMRRKLDALSIERSLLLEKLGDLEDESAAVKVSLIQLLQEKSATNKTLALENYRLSQRVRRYGSRSSTGESPGSMPTLADVQQDNVSVHSAYNISSAEDATLHEAYMGAAMGENFVHKQGFLVKQGGRVKNWKRRLFVLSSEGLSYYKTEQPIYTIPIDKIEKVVTSHGNSQQPNMFEVHTKNRTFYMSAKTGEEMQSWVGMLETLKQYNRTAMLQQAANARMSASIDEEGRTAGTVSDEAVIVSSPEREVEGRETEEDEEEEEGEEGGEEAAKVAVRRKLSPKTASLQMEDDDTSYLRNLRTGGGMSAPTHEAAADILKSLDLSNM